MTCQSSPLAAACLSVRCVPCPPHPYTPQFQWMGAARQKVHTLPQALQIKTQKWTTVLHSCRIAIMCTRTHLMCNNQNDRAANPQQVCACAPPWRVLVRQLVTGRQVWRCNSRSVRVSVRVPGEAFKSSQGSAGGEPEPSESFFVFIHPALLLLLLQPHSASKCRGWKKLVIP